MSSFADRAQIVADRTWHQTRAAFLIIFAAVNVAAARLAKRSSQRALAVAAAVACAASLIALILEERSRNLWGVVIVGGLFGGSFAIEALYRKVTHRVIASHLATPSKTADRGST